MCGLERNHRKAADDMRQCAGNSKPFEMSRVSAIRSAQFSGRLRRWTATNYMRQMFPEHSCRGRFSTNERTKWDWIARETTTAIVECLDEIGNHRRGKWFPERTRFKWHSTWPWRSIPRSSVDGGRWYVMRCATIHIRRRSKWEKT